MPNLSIEDGCKIRNDVFSETRKALNRHGITADFLARLLKKELKAKVSKTMKFKGKVENGPDGKPALQKGVTILALGEKHEIAKDGDELVHYDDGDTVITWDEVAWDVRQRARMDAQKLLEMYPIETSKIQFDEVTLNAILTALPAGVREVVRAELVAAISAKRD